MCKTLLFLCAVFLSGCAALVPPPAPQKQTFSFDYKMPSTEKPGSAGMVLALVKPNYGNNFEYTDNELFKRLQASMADDVEELIIDKGFRIKSAEPFESLDEMIFDDKRNTDIAIKVELNPEFTAADGSWRSNINIGPITYSYSGTVSLIGKISLTGIEPLSGQKIWAKSVSIPEIRSIPVRTQLRYASTTIPITTLINDPGIFNAVGAAFQEQYKAVMDKIGAHFSPQEFASLKSQIKELKTKKGY